MTAVYYNLALGTFIQDWTDISQIVANDDWSGVDSIMGYLGDYTTGSPTNVDARTLDTEALGAIDVIANQPNPNTQATGGVAEFHLADPTVALQGSGTADAPSLVLYLDATGRSGVRVQATIRDIDGSADDAVQQLNVQYRTSPSGAWINVPGGYFADVTVASGTMSTLLNVLLPTAADNAATLEVRFVTTNAGGSDEWVGIDDIQVSSDPITVEQPGILSIVDADATEGDAGTTQLAFTVNRDGGDSGAVSATWTIAFNGNAAATDLVAGQALTGSVEFIDGQTSSTIVIEIAGDIEFEPNETFSVALSAPTGGASLGDAVATGTILNDDPTPSAGEIFINEIHYDNSSTDVGEAIEVAGPAGTSLAGWSLVLYNGNGGAAYATIPLSGVFADQDDGYGTLSFAATNIQNGAPDGIALVDAEGQVIQFLSYEGSFIATSGPAAGIASTDIGVAEEPVPGPGLSLQLTGAGATYEDFTWTSASDDSFGGVNQDQDFIGAEAAGQVTIGDVAIVEGDAGTSQMVFTVRRAGGLNHEASVDWLLSLTGEAGIDDLGPDQPLAGHIVFATGVASVQVTVEVAGDTVGEANETFEILLANPVGNIVITDASAIGTILNDDPIALAIYEIQGEGHRSAYEGQPVATSGVVTAVAGNGFYLQDIVGDGNSRTSDALFVFTGAAPGVVAGDAVEVRGTVSEFLPGGDSAGLTVTQLTADNVVLVSTGNDVPDAVLIGTGGVSPPDLVIDDDGLTSYDPATDGIDFYEALEGMRVTIDAPLVVAETTAFGETWVVASGGDGASGVNARGGITLSDGDYNPEKIQIDATPGLFAGYDPHHSQGDILSDVTGIMSYGFNSYELLVTEAVTVVEDVAVTREITSLESDRDHLTVASYNVENLDPSDSAAKFDLLAGNIVYNLSAPDIIGLQEVQDGNGLGGSDPLSGIVTAQLLIDAIAAIGGPNYVYVEIAPSSPNSTGGEPNGNIRNGFLYNADRVSYVEGSAELIEDPAFNGSRRPLVADFTFNGETVTLINVHFTSRIGSDPLWGSVQPPADAGDAARTAQAEAVRGYVNDALATDPSLKLGVLGDFNGFWFEDAVGALEAGGVMTDLHQLLSEAERYSYLFEGNLQAIDHVVVTGGLAFGAEFDAVHINAEQTDGTERGTDHDPVLARFLIEAPNEAPVDLEIDDATVEENAPAGTLVGTVSAEDIDGDVLSYSLVDDAAGRFALDAATGALTTTATFDHEAQASYDIIVRATDPDGLSTERVLTIQVADVNEAPAATDDAAAVNEDATTPNLWGQLLGNDADPDAGDTLAIASVDTVGTRGSVQFDPGAETLVYVADDDSFDQLAPGETFVDSFSYTVIDENGLTSTATVSVTVTGVADGVVRFAPLFGGTVIGTPGEDVLTGLLGNDTLRGEGGHDILFGGLKDDSLFGGDGNDYLVGGLHDDRLDGGAGDDDLNGGLHNDRLTGGSGADRFHAELAGGKDVVTDYEAGLDSVVLDWGVGVRSSKVQDTNHDGVKDLVLSFTGGATLTLLNVDDIALVTFEAADDLSGLPLF